MGGGRVPATLSRGSARNPRLGRAHLMAPITRNYPPTFIRLTLLPQRRVPRPQTNSAQRLLLGTPGLCHMQSSLRQALSWNAAGRAGLPAARPAGRQCSGRVQPRAQKGFGGDDGGKKVSKQLKVSIAWLPCVAN